jgi:hypothetical protein
MHDEQRQSVQTSTHSFRYFGEQQSAQNAPRPDKKDDHLYTFPLRFLGELGDFTPAEAGVNSWTKISTSRQWRDISCDNNGKICYATEYGGYLYKSLNYGATWKKYVNQFYYGDQNNWEKIGVQTVQNMTYYELVLGTYNTTGAYDFESDSYFYPEYEDDNYTWTGIAMTDLVFTGLSGNVWGGGTFLAHTTGLEYYYFSECCGTWNTVFRNKGFLSVAVSGNGKYIVAGPSNGGLYMSTNHSSQTSDFHVVSSFPTTAHVQTMAINTDGQYMIATGPDGTYISEDFGTTWMNNGFPLEFTSLSIDKTGQKVVGCVANDGIYISSDVGQSWTKTDAQASTWVKVDSDSNFTRLFATDQEYLYAYETNTV